MVPFVGCPSDGQLGPLPAPRGKDRRMAIWPADGQRLAYFKAEGGQGVLAPRGWHCFGVYGSNGSSLFVSPEHLDAEKYFGGNWKGFSGDAIQLSISYGGTSGRFAVAKIIARVFPARRKFVDRVIREDIQPAGSFPFGPFPKDKLTDKGKSIVEYETPAQSEGLGTESRLLKNEGPIRGAEILIGDEPDLISLSVRLSNELSKLESIIRRQVERIAAPH
jgi:hypothetical protein